MFFLFSHLVLDLQLDSLDTMVVDIPDVASLSVGLTVQSCLHFMQVMKDIIVVNVST